MILLAAGPSIVGRPGERGLASRRSLELTSYHHHPPSNLSGKNTISPYCHPDCRGYYCSSSSSAERVRSRKHINRTIRTTITHRTLVWRGTPPYLHLLLHQGIVAIMVRRQCMKRALKRNININWIKGKTLETETVPFFENNCFLNWQRATRTIKQKAIRSGGALNQMHSS